MSQSRGLVGTANARGNLYVLINITGLHVCMHCKNYITGNEQLINLETIIIYGLNCSPNVRTIYFYCIQHKRKLVSYL